MTWLLALPALLALPVLFAAGLATATPAVLRRLPAPVDEPESDPYRPLATPGTALAVFLLAAPAGTLVTVTAPAQALGWLGLTGPGLLAAVVDARTGFLPARLAQASWLLTGAGLLVSATWSGAEMLLRAGLGGLAAGALFWVFWRFGGGFGFGDVRLAPVIGATTAAMGWPMLLAALLLGGLLGAGWGVIWRALGKGRSFPYGPALVAGPYLALLANATLSAQ